MCVVACVSVPCENKCNRASTCASECVSVCAELVGPGGQIPEGLRHPPGRGAAPGALPAQPPHWGSPASSQGPHPSWSRAASGLESPPVTLRSLQHLTVLPCLTEEATVAPGGHPGGAHPFSPTPCPGEAPTFLRPRVMLGLRVTRWGLEGASRDSRREVLAIVGEMGNDSALCASVCVCACTCVCMCVHVCRCAHGCMCIRVHVCPHVCVYTCGCVYMCTRMCVHVCTCVVVYVCIHVCVVVYECVWQGGEVGTGTLLAQSHLVCQFFPRRHTLTHSHLKKQAPAHLLGPLIITPRAPPQDPGFTLAWGSHPCCPNEA